MLSFFLVSFKKKKTACEEAIFLDLTRFFNHFPTQAYTLFFCDCPDQVQRVFSQALFLATPSELRLLYVIFYGGQVNSADLSEGFESTFSSQYL